MAEIVRPLKADGGVTWEEESGLLAFLSIVHAEVSRFDDTFDFGVKALPGQPEDIDGSTEELKQLGFVAVRDNSRLTGRDYCLYSLLQGEALHGYIGIYDRGSIRTVRELGTIKDFRNASPRLLDWLRDLIKASCDKI